MTSRDDCDDVQRLISEGLDRPLTAHETTAVRTHLAGCAACAAFERALRAGTAGLVALPRVPANPRVREAIMDEIERGRFGRPRGARGWLRQGLQIAGSGAAFALVALLLITVIGSGAGRSDEGDEGAGGVGAGAGASPTAGESVPMVPSAATPTAGTPLPDCVPGQYELLPDALEATLDDGKAIIITVGAIKSSGGALCRLAEDVTVTLVDTAGTPLAVEGNPLTRAIDATVPSDEAGFALAWLNWCGESSEVSLRIEGASSASEQGPLPLPTCEDASQPSKLSDAAAADIAAIDPLPAGPSCMMAGGPEQVDGDVVRIVMGVSTDPECLNADGTVTFSLRDGLGELLPVEGNPLSLVPQPLEGEEGIGVVGVEWTSWCGTADGLMADVTYPSGGGGTSVQATPPCIEGQPSQLIALANPADFFTMPPTGAPPQPVAPMPEPFPPCDLGSVELGMTTEPINGMVLIGVKASDASGPCSIQSGFSITIADAEGEPLAIESDPAIASIPDELGVNGISIGGATWQNWCHAADAAIVTATLGDATATATVDTLPSCLDGSQPSTLSVIYGYDAVEALEPAVTVEATPTE